MSGAWASMMIGELACSRSARSSARSVSRSRLASPVEEGPPEALLRWKVEEERRAAVRIADGTPGLEAGRKGGAPRARQHRVDRGAARRVREKRGDQRTERIAHRLQDDARFAPGKRESRPRGHAHPGRELAGEGDEASWAFDQDPGCKGVGLEIGGDMGGERGHRPEGGLEIRCGELDLTGDSPSVIGELDGARDEACEARRRGDRIRGERYGGNRRRSPSRWNQRQPRRRWNQRQSRRRWNRPQLRSGLNPEWSAQRPSRRWSRRGTDPGAGGRSDRAPGGANRRAPRAPSFPRTASGRRARAYRRGR